MTARHLIVVQAIGYYCISITITSIRICEKKKYYKFKYSGTPFERPP